MATNVQELTKQAQDLVAAGRHLEAVQTCRRILLLHPEHQEVRALLGRALLALDRWEEAKDELQVLAHATQSDPGVFLLLARASLMAEQVDDAKRWVQRAAAIDPNSTEIRDLAREVEARPVDASNTISRWFDPKALATGAQDAARELASEYTKRAEPEWEGQATRIDAETSAPPEKSRSKTTLPRADKKPKLTIRIGEGLRQASRRPSSSPSDSADDLPPEATAATAEHISSDSNPSQDGLASDRTVAAEAPEPRPAGRSNNTPPLTYAARPGSPSTKPRVPQGSGAPRAAHTSNPPAPRASDPPRVPTASVPPRPAFPMAGPTPRRPLGAAGAPSHDSNPDLYLSEAGPSPVTAVVHEDELSEVSRARRNEQGIAVTPAQRTSGPPPRPSQSPARPASVRPSQAARNARPGEEGATTTARPQVMFQRFGAGRSDAAPAGDERPGARPESTEEISHLSKVAIPAPGPEGPTRHVARMSAAPLGYGPPWQRLLKTAVLHGSPLAWFLAMGLLLFARVANVGAVVATQALSAYRMQRAIDNAVAEAESEGSLPAWQRALAAVEASPKLAGSPLEARLRVTIALEHGEGDLEGLRQRLAALAPEALATRDGLLAQIAFELVRGDSAGALAAAQRMISANPGVSDPELELLRSIAADRTGDVTQASTAAEAALLNHPDAWRFRTRAARTRSFAASPDKALELFGKSTIQVPSARVAHATILFERQGLATLASAELNGVLADGTASALDKASAHAELARVALAKGDLGTAATEALAAQEGAPLRPEALQLSLISTILAAELPERAEALARALPPKASDPRLRATLMAEISIGKGKLDEADKHLQSAGKSGRVARIQGRIFELRGGLFEARSKYEEAASDRAEFVPAQLAIGRLELTYGRPRDAIGPLESALKQAPGSGLVTLWLARAYALSRQPAKLTALLADTEKLNPGSAELEAAKAWSNALTDHSDQGASQLAAAASKRPNHPMLHSQLGDFHRMLGNADHAIAAYEAAIKCSAGYVDAHVGRAAAILAAGDLQGAESAIKLLEDQAVAKLATARLRARLLADRGLGDRVTRQASALAKQFNDPVIWAAAAELYWQAAQIGPSQRAIASALHIEKQSPEALLVRALGESLRDKETAKRAESRIDALIHTAEEFGLGPNFAARAQAVRALAFAKQKDYDAAEAAIRASVKLMPNLGLAYWALAVVRMGREVDPIPALRQALREGVATPPVAQGQLALALRSGDEACTLTASYLKSVPLAPLGKDIRKLNASCR